MPRGEEDPAFLLASVAGLEQRADVIVGAGFEISWAERETLEGYVRFHCRDGFGNRVEIFTPAT